MKRNTGFTIVELLIVIVVIAILAAITIVAYNGIQDRAKASAASSALSNAVKKIKLWQVEQDTTLAPITLAAAGINDGGGVSYQYTSGQSTASDYCITANIGNKSYKLSSGATTTSEGGCTVTNLVTNPSLRIGITGWVGSSATISRVTSPWSADGNGAIQVAATGQDSFAQTIVPVQAGQIYTILGTINLQSAQTGSFQGSGQQRNIFAAFHDTGGNYISTGAGGVSTPQSNATGTYTQRITVTTPANAAQARIRFYNGASAGNTVYWDQIMVVQGSYNGPYADGETSGWIWNGTANDSSSAGPMQ